MQCQLVIIEIVIGCGGDAVFLSKLGTVRSRVSLPCHSSAPRRLADDSFAVAPFAHMMGGGGGVQVTLFRRVGSIFDIL
jgi:hypothetical protein